MFALKCSRLSIPIATRRCPALVSRLSKSYSTTSPPLDNRTPIDFLQDPTPPTGPTSFPDVDDGPPTGPPVEAKYLFHANLVKKTALPKYKLHCHSSRNNTIVTFTRPDGGTIAWFSGGSTKDKFKKGNRSSFQAGYQCAISIFAKIIEWNSNQERIALEVLFKGYGEGREAMKTALLAAEGEQIRTIVASVTDRTPIKIGGTRSKKMRRG